MQLINHALHTGDAPLTVDDALLLFSCSDHLPIGGHRQRGVGISSPSRIPAQCR